jgi:hypothetical protein
MTSKPFAFMDLFRVTESAVVNVDDSDTERETDELYDKIKVQQQDVETIINDPYEFNRLKLALKAKGAITNGILQQRFHVYMLKNKSRLHYNQRRRASISNDDNSAQRPSDFSSISLAVLALKES